MSETSCLHVHITATRQQLDDIGICSARSFDLLLSGRAFAVEKKEPTTDGKVIVYLVDPESKDHLLWVYDEFCEPVTHVDQ